MTKCTAEIARLKENFLGSKKSVLKNTGMLA